jgi:hypothetical protein
MSIAIQDLPDVLKIVVLLNLHKDEIIKITSLERVLNRVCSDQVCFESRDLSEALNEMVSEGLISIRDGAVQLTHQGTDLSRDWRGLLLKREPVLEIVAGLTDGSITGLVIILSALIAGLPTNIAVFAAFLTLSSVAITNFSSFLLGGITEDISDMITLQNLVRHSLRGIADKKKRDRSLMFVSELFTLLHRQLSRANLYAATLCSITTFAAGFIPISMYLSLPYPLNVLFSLGIAGAVVGGFLVRYRSRRTKVHWKVTLLETIVIILIAVVASLLLGGHGI